MSNTDTDTDAVPASAPAAPATAVTAAWATIRDALAAQALADAADSTVRRHSAST